MPVPHPSARSHGYRTWIQVGASVAVLAATLAFVDRAEVWRSLRLMQPGWLALTFAVLLLQFVLMAARWWFFARKLSVPLPYRRALGEYFLAGLLNQVLPFGILGDVTRALRHAQTARNAPSGSANHARVVLAIVLERAAGQVGLWLVVAAVLPTWWVAGSRLPGHSLAIGFLVGAIAVALIVVARVAWQRRKATPELKRLVAEGARAMFAPIHLAAHLPLSLLVVASHAFAFVAIAHGMGLSLPFSLAVRVVPLVLVATTLPLFMAGWGVREATVASLYHLAGLRGAEGVTIALVYGCLSLLASVPGILALRRKADERAPTRVVANELPSTEVQ
jgi:glycosyltransferase 2 family protein